MSEMVDYGVPRGEEERDALARILSESFHAPVEAIQERFPNVGSDNLRVYLILLEFERNHLIPRAFQNLSLSNGNSFGHRNTSE